MATEDHVIGVGGMSCNACADRVTEALSALPGVIDVRVELEQKHTVVSVGENGPDRQALAAAIRGAGYPVIEPGCGEESAETSCDVPVAEFNWRDRATWYQSARNTKWCLIGCSIGEFGTLAAYQVMGTGHLVPPATPLYYFLLVLPLINGLITSVIFETILLMRGQMDFRKSLSTALGMSFISMLMMEVAMEVTDLVATGGLLGMNYYAIPVMLFAGFITPWPYNYWRLKKHGAACH